MFERLAMPMHPPLPPPPTRCIARFARAHHTTAAVVLVASAHKCASAIHRRISPKVVDAQRRQAMLTTCIHDCPASSVATTIAGVVGFVIVVRAHDLWRCWWSRWSWCRCWRWRWRWRRCWRWRWRWRRRWRWRLPLLTLGIVKRGQHTCAGQSVQVAHFIEPHLGAHVNCDGRDVGEGVLDIIP